MLDLLKISVTGDPSSGKTEACQVFEDLGAFVISADKVSHSFLVPYTSVGQRVIDLLGPEIIIENTLNRKAIAEKVFGDQDLLLSLEKILHPEVCRFVEERYAQVVQEQKYSLFIVEVPLLYEIQYADWFDRVILISADTGIRKERFLKKTGGSDTSFDLRCARFSALEEKILRADVVIENNGTKEEFRRKVKQCFKALKGTI